MTRKVCATGTFYACRTRGCSNHGAHTDIVVDAVLDSLRTWVIRFSEPEPSVAKPAPKANTSSSALTLARSSLVSVENQLSTARDMLERGVYSVDEFLQRRETLNAKIQNIRDQISALEQESSQRSPEDIIRSNIPQIKRVLDAWSSCKNAEEQNALLRTVVSRIILSKDIVGNRSIDSREFISLTMYPYSNE